ncbi:uncharacterized protein LOC128521147 [Clarias gariepinus]|uniref:uncharacterized protein LOC128521147 n=1 Tax=Clarias gariepinus TaxID=13013 RepID=UPI00234DE6F5|nr:uncharacterized protein LOC128521147 [Clarias gariepinus]
MIPNRLIHSADPGKDQVKEPQVSVYLVSRKSNGKAVLLCQAKGMFPDLVRFKWKTINQDGRTMDLNTEERLEQRDKEPEVRITSMLIVDQQKAMNNKFICSVQHTNNAKEQELVISKESKPGLFISCPPPKAEEMEEEEFMDSGLFNPSPSLYLFSMTYSVHSDVELHQELVMTRAINKLAKINCIFPSKCKHYIHWYQKKDGEPFKRVQYVNIDVPQRHELQNYME